MKNKLILIALLGMFVQFAFAKKNLPFNVLSYNIRVNVSIDGENQWPYRRSMATRLVKFHNVDIFGAQEVTHLQLVDMMNDLPEFDYIGVGRIDGKQEGEYTPIIYRKDRFKLLKSGNFWLSENKDAVGKKGWDAAYERVATWGLFKDKRTGKKFFFLNTHLDHMGKVARHNGAQLVLDEAARLSEGAPIMVTGDFNASPEEEPIKVLTNTNDPNHLIHAKEIAECFYGPEWTYHGFGRNKLENRPWIDYLFLKGNFQVTRYGVLTDAWNGLYPSDHCPVLGTLIIK